MRNIKYGLKFNWELKNNNYNSMIEASTVIITIKKMFQDKEMFWN